MAEVLAGLVCGFGLALIATPIMAIALLRASATNETVRRTVPEGTSLLAISVLLHFFAFLVLTAIGMLLGLALAGLESRSPDGGLGSPNGAYTALILISTAIAVAPLSIAAAGWRKPLLAGGLIFAGVFGWLMPYLSLLGPNGS